MNPEEITDYIRARFAVKRNWSATFKIMYMHEKYTTVIVIINKDGSIINIEYDEFINNYLKPFIANELQKKYYTIIATHEQMQCAIIELAIEDDAHILK